MAVTEGPSSARGTVAVARSIGTGQLTQVVDSGTSFDLGIIVSCCSVWEILGNLAIHLPEQIGSVLGLKEEGKPSELNIRSIEGTVIGTDQVELSFMFELEQIEESFNRDITVEVKHYFKPDLRFGSIATILGNLMAD